MKKAAKKLIKHPLIRGSTIVIFGGILANFFNFLFNLFMNRMLGVSDYGTLASIISLITFPALIVTAINPVVVRFAGDYFARNDQMLLRGLYKKLFNFLLLAGFIIFILFLLFLSQISQFFHITNYLILVFADVIILLTFITTLNASFLQAKLSFGVQVIINLATALLKLILGVLFIWFGYAVAGAVGAIAVAGIGGWIFSSYPLRSLLFNKTKTLHMETKELFRYGIPSALTLLGLTSFISTDIILVKHFFTPIAAGQYAGLSLIGRVIFYISAPIGTVMFPLIVQKHTKGENLGSTFKLAVGVMLLPSLFLTLFYFFFPKFSILFFLKRPDYLTVMPLLGIFGLYITCYCVLYLFANFYLSIKKTTIFIPILLGAILQIVLIVFYHQSFLQIITISFTLVLLLMIGFLLYYPYATKK